MTRVCFAGALIVLGFAGVARAEEPDSSALVSQGLQLRRQGKTEEALALFERAHALAPSPRTLGQLGLAEASLGRWLDAEKHLDTCLGAERDAWVRRNKVLLQQAMETASRHVGRVTFTGPAGAVVSVGGTPVGALPIPGPVRVGEGLILVAASAPGFQRVIETVEVVGGRHVTLAIEMKPIDLRPPQVTEVRSADAPRHLEPVHSTWRPWTAAGLLAVGGAGLVWGTVWIATDARESRGYVHHRRYAGWVVAGTGVALAAAGGVVLLVGRRGDVTTAVVATATGIGLAGTF